MMEHFEKLRQAADQVVRAWDEAHDRSKHMQYDEVIYETFCEAGGEDAIGNLRTLLGKMSEGGNGK